MTSYRHIFLLYDVVSTYFRLIIEIVRKYFKIIRKITVLERLTLSDIVGEVLWNLMVYGLAHFVRKRFALLHGSLRTYDLRSPRKCDLIIRQTT